MSKSVPMVRAMSLIPAVRWLFTHGHPIEPLLSAAGLGSGPFGDPLRPVALLNVGRLLREIARAEGPDVPCRIVSEANVREIAMLGRVALGTRTPADALDRIASALPLFCSHEQLSISRKPETVVIRHFYTVDFDHETAHLMLQYAVAIADRMCAMTGAASPRLSSVELAPHPTSGLDHLVPWFGSVLEPAPGPSTKIVVDRAIADRVFLSIARDRTLGQRPPGIAQLRGDGSLAGSASIILSSMLEESVPTARQLADACGMSLRTLQRRLSEEGTSFSTLLSQVRKGVAKRRLAAGRTTVASISAELGYTRQTSLTRAMRRWTGLPPTRFQKQRER